MSLNRIIKVKYKKGFFWQLFTINAEFVKDSRKQMAQFYRDCILLKVNIKKIDASSRIIEPHPVVIRYLECSVLEVLRFYLIFWNRKYQQQLIH